jgi:FKBP-type peptidyl-prolyl cis-trans isomerase 2
LIGKELKNYTIIVPPEAGFGKKDPRLMKLVPLAAFHQQKIAPFPGLQIRINNTLGTVRTVSGGRIIVDFNHPLAGRNLEYEVTIKRVVTQTEEKLQSYVVNLFNKPVFCTYAAGKATMTLDLPEQFHKTLVDHIKKVVPEIKEVIFQSEKISAQKTENKTDTQV